VYRSQPRFPSKLLERLVIILTLLAGVEAGLRSSGLYLSPKLGLLPTVTFAFSSPEAAPSPHVMQAGLFRDLWDKLRGDPGPPPSAQKNPSPGQILPDVESQRRDQLRRLQMLHDKERDLSKKIEYDRQIIDMLHSYNDFEKIKALQSEIEQHEQEAQQLAKEQKREQAISQAKQALEEKRYKDAEREAEIAIQIFDDAQTRQLLNEAKTRRLVEEAKDALAAKDVDESYKKNRQALHLSPNDREGQRIQRDIDNFLGRRKTLLVLKIALILLLTAGLLIGLYILLRPRKWVLEGIDGVCKEEIFPLDADEVKIGALGPPHGECDIVIRDGRRKISQLHCVIVRNGRSLYLINESLNGTMINDEEVEKGSMKRLRNGDRLSLADEVTLLLRRK
jgi:hypothetical protein